MLDASEPYPLPRRGTARRPVAQSQGKARAERRHRIRARLDRGETWCFDVAVRRALVWEVNATSVLLDATIGAPRWYENHGPGGFASALLGSMSLHCVQTRALPKLW